MPSAFSLLSTLLLSLTILVALPLPATAQSKTAESVRRLEKEIATIRLQLDRIERMLREKNDEKAAAPEPVTSKGDHLMKVWIVPGDWAGGQPNDILAVCNSTADSMLKFVEDKPGEPVILERSAKQGPMVVFGKTAEGRRRVLLNTSGRFWSQYAFQFSHEVCHILCNYRNGNKANQWFEESLCETASLFALREMGKSWKTKPPYPNWKSFAPHLTKYAQDRIDATSPLDGQSLADWYRENRMELRANGTVREKNAVVARALLELFEKHPAGWQAVRSLNQWKKERELSLEEYLTDWHERVEKEHKGFVKEIAAMFEITIA